MGGAMNVKTGKSTPPTRVIRTVKSGTVSAMKIRKRMTHVRERIRFQLKSGTKENNTNS